MYYLSKRQRATLQNNPAPGIIEKHAQAMIKPACLLKEKIRIYFPFLQT